MLKESTELSDGQLKKLDTLARANPDDPDGDSIGLDPGAKIIDHLGRYEDYFMPIILRSDGRTQKLQPGGRLTPFKE